MTTIGIGISQLLRDCPDENAARSNPGSSVSMCSHFEKILTCVEVLADGFTVALAVVGGYAAYHLLELGKRLEYPDRMVWLVAFAMAALDVILLDRDGAYQSGNSLLRIKETERSLRVSAQTFLLVLPVTFFTSHIFSRGAFAFALVSVPLLQVLEKQLLFLAVRALRSKGLGIQNVLIYGAGSNGRRIFSALTRSLKLGLNPVAIIDDNSELHGRKIFEYGYRRSHSLRVISAPITRELLEKHQCRFVVIAIPDLDGEKFARVAEVARQANARLAFIPGHAAETEYWTEHADLDGTLLSLVGRPAKHWYYQTAKRPFDLLGAFALMVCLAPLWLLIAILVHLDSPGPSLFCQKRVGLNGKLFDLYKFRSMHVDSPAYEFSPNHSDDPRITSIGRFLRRSSLDELPQLINVLKGEMSLVGPRPEMPFIVNQYNSLQRQRLHVTPGITGLWQLSADREFRIHENIQYDLYYIRNRSFFMDIAILLHTVVFAMRGV
jgi:exopolysaccharide biosynthesis polyprenyl glycosylphosphotransferase